MIPRIWQWLTDPASWSGPGGIGARVTEHLLYAVVIVALAALVAVPLGVWVGHSGRGRALIALGNSLRAVPTLGLLFAVSLVVGPLISGQLAFVIPSVIVLVLLAIPPLLAGTYAGIEAVDPAARDAGRGMGMTGWQLVRGVEVPAALPLILSGLRSAVLQVVATATIAAYIGLGGLGRFLIDGLATGDYAEMAGGALLVAALALALDALLALATRGLVSPGLRPQRARRVSAGKHPSPRGVDVPTPS